MLLECDPHLIEESVFLEIRKRERTGYEEITQRYRREIEPLYALPLHDPERERGFQAINRKFFSELGLMCIIKVILPQFPLLSENLNRLVLLKAVKHRQEGAELFVRAERESDRTVRSGVVYLLPQRFLNQEELEGILIRELLHISDMVDPEFGYDPTLRLEEPFLPQENLIRDRYRILWELSIHERLRGWKNGSMSENDRLETLFRKVFVCLSPDECDLLWIRLKRSSRLSHQDLLQIAKTPRDFLKNSPDAAEPVC